LFLLGLTLQFILNGGPIVVGGVSFGANTLTVGSLLTPVGFNLVIFGVVAKALMAQRYAGLSTKTLRWIRYYFSLESGLIAGGTLTFIGVGIDVAFKCWPTVLEQIERTIHVSFIATTALVLGINLMFSAFLLHMMFVVTAETRWVGPQHTNRVSRVGPADGPVNSHQ
jgi:hypothetical protein